jgi:hypothetical protein
MRPFIWFKKIAGIYSSKKLIQAMFIRKRSVTERLAERQSKAAIRG